MIRKLWKRAIALWKAKQLCEAKSREVDLEIVRLEERVKRVERDSGIIHPPRRASAS